MLVKMSLFIADIEERVNGFYDALKEKSILSYSKGKLYRGGKMSIKEYES